MKTGRSHKWNPRNTFRLLLHVGIWSSVCLLQAQNPPLPDLPSIVPDDPALPASGALLPPLPSLDEAPAPMPQRVRPSRKVVILRDDESWYFDTFADKVKAELEKLSIDSYQLKFEDFNAKGNATALTQKLNLALAKPETDMIIAAGFVATGRALELDAVDRTRPVLGGAVEFSDMLENSISPEGTSKVANYSFITNPQRIAADIEALKYLSEQNRIYVVVDKSLFYASGRVRDVNNEKREVEKEYGVSIEILPSEGSVESIVSAIPSGARAVYISILPSIPPKERTRMFELLSKRGCVTLSMVGLPDVRLGAMAGLAPDNGDAIAKRAALNAHQILLGIDPRILPVYLPVEDRLIINRASAELAGWYPNYEIALTAEFLNEEGRETGEELTLERVMKIAASGNIDVKIQKEEELISGSDLRKAESFQRPTVSINAQQSFTDYVDRINRILTPDHLHAGSYGMELRQSLFNDTIRKNIGSALEGVAAERLNTCSERMDAMEAAGVAFLNYLAARSLWQIQRENLRLSENNLQLARLRVNIGAVEASETYRWEQDAASSRASVFQAKADRENARIELNRIMGEPREKQWKFVDIELGDRDTYFMNDAINRHIRYQDDAFRFGDFLRKVAVPASPELAAFDFGLSAQGIELCRIERSFFLPEISGLFSYNRIGQGTEILNYTTQSEAFAGVSLTVPVYEGGFRQAERSGQKAVIRQLAAQRERALQFIEQRALTAFNGLFSEHPNIRLSRRGLVSAEKNYAATREKYAQGAATILDLLDAQSALLRQRQQASLAVYSYLQQVVQMQRSISWFEFEKNPTQKRQWSDMLATYMKREELVMPKCTKPDPNKDFIENRAQAAVHSATPCIVEPENESPHVDAKPAGIRAVPVVIQETSPAPAEKAGLFKRIFTTRTNP
ncbi:MAG: TolC family protein [Verrucomicrobiales bacterium]|nr:TolC family protein [Verrucomicrobiales bacterium]